MQLERTLIILKPDALARRLLGKIISRFEQKGMALRGLKMMKIPTHVAQKQYAAHKAQDFYEPLIRYMTSMPVVVMVLEGKDACNVARAMMGATFGSSAAAGTIRGDLAISNRFNLVHGSDSPEAAKEEIDLYFREDELFAYEVQDLSWVYDLSGGDIV
jgi:nucleoside-diphosphate kinase